MNKQQLIEKLSLVPHVEGGYFSCTYRSGLMTDSSVNLKPRCLLTSIFYMLTDDSPIGHLHKNTSDIVHYFQGGSPLNYLIVHPNGVLENAVLGDNLNQGQQMQLIVPGGCWKATELKAGEFALVGEAVSPGFEYEDMELANESIIKTSFPHLWESLSKFVRY